MGKKGIGLLLMALTVIVFPGNGSCLNSEDILRLKQAGISDTTLQLIIREKVIETAALSVDDILSLKQAGISEDTIQMLIRERSFRHDKPYRVYGSHTGSVRHGTIGDLMEMKDRGFEEDVLQALIIYNSENYGSAEKERAWQMLTQMGLIVDGRPWMPPNPKK